MFLGYLTFTRAGYAGGPAWPVVDIACASDVDTAGCEPPLCFAEPLLPCPLLAGSGSAGAGSSEADSAAPAAAGLVDVAATVEAAAAASEGGPLAWALPWVVRYLWFLPWDAEAVRAPYFRCLLARLAALHGSAELQPQQAHFSLAAFCLRSVLDDFAERVGPDIMPTAPGSSGSSSSSAGGATCPALSSLAAVDGLLDSRFLHLCCPTLEHSRQLFAASGGGGGGLQQQQQARRVKKIRPTAPSGAAAARTALQGGVAAALQQDASRDLLRLQLQRAFLEQYSTDEHKVGRELLGRPALSCPLPD